MPFADRLFSIAIEFQRHHSVAEDALAPSTRVVAALRDVSSNRLLLAVGCGLGISLRRGWKLKEELFRSELESHEAGNGNVCGDLLDEFGGQR